MRAKFKLAFDWRDVRDEIITSGLGCLLWWYVRGLDYQAFIALGGAAPLGLLLKSRLRHRLNQRQNGSNNVVEEKNL